MREIRRYKRFQVEIIEISGKMMLASYVNIFDISIGGISFRVDRRVNIGSEYTLKIQGKGKELTVKGIIVRSAIVDNSRDSRGNIVPIYAAGMRFIDVSAEKLKEIAAFMESNLKDVDKQVDLYSSSGRRLYVRVYIESSEESLLKFYESYKVKNLSLGGMLIESENILVPGNTLPLEIVLAEDKSIKVSGKVISCSRTKDNKIERYDIGMEFLDMTEKDKNILNEFLRLLDNLKI
jgi:c-di-GMP-binding flagellar brake protein YcgR